MTTLSGDDLMDVSEWDAAGATFNSRKLSYTNLLASLNTDLPLGDTSLYAADGTLAGNRAVNGGGFNLSFTNLPTLSIAGNLAIDTSTLFVDSGTNRVGIGTATPTQTLEVVGTFGTVSTANPAGKNQLKLVGPQDANTSILAADNSGAAKSTSIGVRGTTDVSNPEFGNQGDSFIYSDSDANALNIISQTGGSTDNIRFYAGGDVVSLTNSDFHIQGTGGTRGYVGINTDAPAAQLEVGGQVKITGGSPGANKVLTSDAGGLGSWVTPSYAPTTAFATVSTSITLALDTFYLVDTTALTLNLPTPAAGSTGKSIWVKLIIAGTCGVADAGGGTIDGAASVTINVQYKVYQFICSGTAWWVASIG